MKPKEIFPTTTELRNNPEFYKNKILTYRGQRMVFDQEIRTGECYFCKKSGWTKRSTKTNLHHVLYDDSDPLSWTIEVCSSCHYWIDQNNRKLVDRYYDTKRWQRMNSPTNHTASLL
jgi:heterodisulfide reductase subunit B